MTKISVFESLVPAIEQMYRSTIQIVDYYGSLAANSSVLNSINYNSDEQSDLQQQIYDVDKDTLDTRQQMYDVDKNTSVIQQQIYNAGSNILDIYSNNATVAEKQGDLQQQIYDSDKNILDMGSDNTSVVEKQRRLQQQKYDVVSDTYGAIDDNTVIIQKQRVLAEDNFDIGADSFENRSGEVQAFEPYALDAFYGDMGLGTFGGMADEITGVTGQVDALAYSFDNSLSSILIFQDSSMSLGIFADNLLYIADTGALVANILGIIYPMISSMCLSLQNCNVSSGMFDSIISESQVAINYLSATQTAINGVRGIAQGIQESSKIMMDYLQGTNQSSQGVQQTIQGVQQATQGVQQATVAATIAQRAYNVATAANIILGIATAVLSIASAWKSVTSETNSATRAAMLQHRASTGYTASQDTIKASKYAEANGVDMDTARVMVGIQENYQAQRDALYQDSYDEYLNSNSQDYFEFTKELNREIQIINTEEEREIEKALASQKQMAEIEKEMKNLEQDKDNGAKVLLYGSNGEYENSFDVNNVENVNHINGSVDIASEDLRYMRELAEQEAINQFTSKLIQPAINVSFGEVKETADVDGIVQRITNGLVESLNNSSDVVHI